MFDYVKEYYDVPACIGRGVEVSGKRGVIIADRGHYIGVNFDDDKPGSVSNCHPTSSVKYLGMGKIRRMTRSQERYQRYLEWDGCFDSFYHFLMYEADQEKRKRYGLTTDL